MGTFSKRDDMKGGFQNNNKEDNNKRGKSGPPPYQVEPAHDRSGGDFLVLRPTQEEADTVTTGEGKERAGGGGGRGEGFVSPL